MIDAVFLLLFVLLCFAGTYARKVFGLLLICLLIVLICDFEISLIDNTICAVILGTLCSHTSFKLSTKILLCCAAIIQFLSMLSNMYFDFEFMSNNKTLHHLAYFVYSVFSPTVIVINVFIIIDTLRIEIRDYRNETYDIDRHRRLHNY